MNDVLKSKLKSYSFWVSLASAVLLLVQTIGRPLGLVIDESTYMSIVNSVLGVFVVLGIISHPAQNLLKIGTTKFEEVTNETNVENNSDLTQDEDKVTQNSSLTAKSSEIVAKSDGVVVDSKSGCDGGETDPVDNANSNLNDDSLERIEKAKQDFINSYK